MTGSGPKPGEGPVVVVGGGAAATFLAHSFDVRGGSERPIVVVDPAQRTGTFAIDARLREGPGGTGAGSLLLPSGERVPGAYL